MGYSPYQLVQDFFHQQHHGISGDLSTLTCTCATHIAKDGFLSTFPTARSQQAVQWPTCSAGARPGLAALKNGGWETTFLLGRPTFRGYVSFFWRLCKKATLSKSKNMLVLEKCGTARLQENVD